MKHGMRALAFFLVATTTLGACSKDKGDGASGTPDSATATTASAAVSGDSMSAMPGMSGMSGMGSMGDGKMMDMHPRMTMMEKSSPDSLKAMLPEHRQMTANMLSQMKAEMRKMNMPADAAFDAIGDSLRQDLVSMAEMDAGKLAQFFPAHHGRMMRYMKSHEGMMKGMKM